MMMMSLADCRPKRYFNNTSPLYPKAAKPSGNDILIDEFEQLVN